MTRFTLPRDIYHGKGSLESLKTFEGKKAMICVGGGSMKRFGFLDRAIGYLKEAGMEVEVFDGIESDPSVETVMRGADAMLKFEPDWIVAIGGGSPIDAAKAMWIKYEYPETTFEDMCKVFGLPKLRTKAHFCAVSSTSGTATEVTAFSIITDYQHVSEMLFRFWHVSASYRQVKSISNSAYTSNIAFSPYFTSFNPFSDR